MKRFLFLLSFIFVFSCARAQELGFMAGAIANNTDYSYSYAWKLSYYDKISNNFLWSFSWYNEGHFTGHHRDGMLLQAWYRFPLADNWYLGLGTGPAYFFDTTNGTNGNYRNIHAFALGSGIDLWYYLKPRLALKASFTSIIADSKNINTRSILIGAAYVFKDPAQAPRVLDYEGTNEINIYVGKTIVNSFSSQDTVATMVEYRRNISKYFDISASFLNEGDTNILRRNGAILQLWPSKRFAGGRMTLGLGLGVYKSIDSHMIDGNEGNPPLAGIVTMSGGYRLQGLPVSLRASWNRVVTSYNRDTDVIMGGVGYYF